MLVLGWVMRVCLLVSSDGNLFLIKGLNSFWIWIWGIIVFWVCFRFRVRFFCRLFVDSQGVC